MYLFAIFKLPLKSTYCSGRDDEIALEPNMLLQPVIQVNISTILLCHCQMDVQNAEVLPFISICILVFLTGFLHEMLQKI
jgi:hypothetical protein